MDQLKNNLVKFYCLIDKISKCKIFRNLHDNFLSNKTPKNYKRLVNFLEFQFNTKFTTKSKTLIPSLILSDQSGSIIWNSNYKNNSCEKYLSGSIPINDVYQFQSLSRSEKNGKSMIIKTVEINGNFTNYNYVSKRIGSSLSAGLVSLTGEGCNGCSCCF